MLENKRILRYSDEVMAYLNYKNENGYYNFNDIKSDQEVLYKGPEDFILTHKTDFLPDNDIIKTKKSTGYENGKHFSIKLGDKEYKYVEYRGRNTIHFSVNGEVMSHELGNWDNRKYAIIIPFTEIPIEQIAEAHPADTFCVGDVNLTEKTYILCPMGTKEDLINNHGIKKAQVIEYPDTYTVTGFANYFIKKLGYNLESANEYTWDSPKSIEQFDRIVKSLGLSSNLHYCSKQNDIDFVDNGVCTLASIAEIICAHFQKYGLYDLSDAISCFQNHLNFIFHFNEEIIENVTMSERISMLDSKLLEIGIEITPEIWGYIISTTQQVGYDTEETKESLKLLFASVLANACANASIRKNEEKINISKS